MERTVCGCRGWMGLFLLLAVWLLDGSLALAAQVEIQQAVVVDASVVRVVDVSHHSADVPEDYLNIVFGRAPAPGQSQVLTAEQIWTRLRQSGLDLGRVEWAVPDTLTITASAQNIDVDQLVSRASDYIRGSVPFPTGDVTITLLRAPAVQPVPKGKLEWQLELPSGLHYRMPTVVKINLLLDGSLYRSDYVQFQLQAVTEVLVSARSLARHEKLDVNNVKLVKRDVAKLPDDVLTQISNIQGKWLRRGVPVDSPITASLIEQPPVILRGELVMIKANLAGMEISMAGTALQDGAVGQVIRVQNNSSRKMLRATVVRPGEVEPVGLGNGG